MTIDDMAFDYAMQRGHGKKDKAHENFVAGAKAVISEVQDAFKIGGIDAVVERLNDFVIELNH